MVFALFKPFLKEKLKNRVSLLQIKILAIPMLSICKTADSRKILRQFRDEKLYGGEDDIMMYSHLRIINLYNNLINNQYLNLELNNYIWQNVQSIDLKLQKTFIT